MKLILSDEPIVLEDGIDTDIRFVDLSSLRIANCIGCFGCWTKTPGCCVLRDDAVKVYPLIAASDRVMYVSRIWCGGYDTPMKTMLERAIPVQQAFLRIHKGETHHVQRDVVPKQATIIGYGDINEEEKELFCRLTERNSYNMNFEKVRVIFCRESELTLTVQKEMKQWRKS